MTLAGVFRLLAASPLPEQSPEARVHPPGRDGLGCGVAGGRVPARVFQRVSARRLLCRVAHPCLPPPPPSHQPHTCTQTHRTPVPPPAAMDWLTQWECFGAEDPIPASACSAGGRGATASAGNACTAAGGRCRLLRDGFYLLSGGCLGWPNGSVPSRGRHGVVGVGLLRPSLRGSASASSALQLFLPCSRARCKNLCPVCFPRRHGRVLGAARAPHAAACAASAGGVAAQLLARHADAQQGSPGMTGMARFQPGSLRAPHPGNSMKAVL